MKLLGFGFSHKQIEKLKVQNGAEYFYRVFLFSFHNIFNRNGPTYKFECLNLLASVFAQTSRGQWQAKKSRTAAAAIVWFLLQVVASIVP